MGRFLKVVGALLLFAVLFGAWISLFVLLPLFGIYRSVETTNPLWMTGASAASGLAYVLWLLAARRLSKGQSGAEWGWPWM